MLVDAVEADQCHADHRDREADMRDRLTEKGGRQCDQCGPGSLTHATARDDIAQRSRDDPSRERKPAQGRDTLTRFEHGCRGRHDEDCAE